MEKIFGEPISFDWNKGNQGKNFSKHAVADEECEEVFFDPDKKIANIIKIKQENQYLLIGKTKKKRVLFVVFTVRDQKIRVISARDINKQERKLYDK